MVGNVLGARNAVTNSLVAVWDAPDDLSKARTRIGGTATTNIVATLTESQEQVRRLIQPLLLPPEKDAPQSGAKVMEVHP